MPTLIYVDLSNFFQSLFYILALLCAKFIFGITFILLNLLICVYHRPYGVFWRMFHEHFQKNVYFAVLVFSVL